MMTRKNDSTGVRQSINAVLLLAVTFAIAQPASAQSQWTTNGNDISNTNTGNVGVGTTSPMSTLHVASVPTSAFRGMVVSQHTDDGNAAFYTVLKARGTIASPTAVINGDSLGSLGSAAYDGTSYVLGGRIRFSVDGGVTPGSIPTAIQFFTVNGANERMRISSAGNVGIGTPAPAGRFHVRGGYATSGMTNPGDAFYLNATGASPNAGQLVFGDNTGWKFHFGTVSGGNFVERLTVMDTGNVGIGTTSPSYLLDVAGSTNTPFRVRDSSGREYFSTTTRTGTYGTSPIVNLSGGRLIIDTDGPEGGNHTVLRRLVNSLIFYPSDWPGYPGALIVRQLDGNNILFVDQNTNGRVGIGTAGPSFKLDVQGGQINASGGFCIAGDCKTAWSQVGGGSSQWTTSGANISYSSGNVGIGTSATSPSYLLDVAGGSNNPFRVRDSSGREYFSTTTRTGTYGTSPIVNLSGGRLIIDTDGPEGGNHTVLRRLVNSLIFYPSDWPGYPGALIVRQLDGNNILFVDQNTNGNVGIGTTAPSSKLQVNGDLTVSGTGNISASGTISGGNVVAKYQDIAEWVPARKPMVAGTVVVLDIERSNQVVASQQAYDTGVAGVVSSSPGVILGQSAPNKVMVATTGRVRVKVDATHAPIRVGDILVTSDKEGIAMKSEPIDLGGAKIHRPGTIIGKALEPLASGVGEILVLLSLQ